MDGAAPDPAPDPALGPTLAETAYRRIEALIVTLELPPGEAVSEASLGRLLGIGTTPVREALQRLSREHLVRILPRRGVVVAGIDVGLQLQVLETRRELDRLLVRSAARRAGEAERDALNALAARWTARPGPDARGVVRLDGEMAGLLARAARNDVAADLAGRLHAVSRRFWFFHQTEAGHGGASDLAETAALHGRVAATVEAGKPEKAATASDALIDHLVRFTRAALPGR